MRPRRLAYWPEEPLRAWQRILRRWRAGEVDTHGPTMKGAVDMLARMRVFDVHGRLGGARIALRVPDEPIVLVAILDREERKAIILRDAKKLCDAKGLTLVEDPGLLEEVAGLAEWPTPILGDMDPTFLTLPPEVIRTSMRTHQK